MSVPQEQALPLLHTKSSVQEYRCGGHLSKKAFFATSCCCGVLVLLAIVLPLVLYVGGPGIAQSSINKSKMTFETPMMLSRFTDDSFLVSGTIRIENAGPFDATVSSTMLDVSFQGQKFATMPLPDTKIIGGKSSVVQVSNVLQEITDHKVFEIASAGLLYARGTEWEITGKTDVFPTIAGMTFKFGIEFDKKIINVASKDAIVRAELISAFQGPNMTVFNPLGTDVVQTNIVMDNKLSSLKISLNGTADIGSPVCALTSLLPTVVQVGPVNIPASSYGSFVFEIQDRDQDGGCAVLRMIALFCNSSLDGTLEYAHVETSGNLTTTIDGVFEMTQPYDNVIELYGFEDDLRESVCSLFAVHFSSVVFAGHDDKPLPGLLRYNVGSDSRPDVAHADLVDEVIPSSEPLLHVQASRV